MGKYYKQAGHYRTYKQTNKRIAVNGGPAAAIPLVAILIFGVIGWLYNVTGCQARDEQASKAAYERNQEKYQYNRRYVEPLFNEYIEQGYTPDQAYDKAKSETHYYERYPEDKPAYLK